MLFFFFCQLKKKLKFTLFVKTLFLYQLFFFFLSFFAAKKQLHNPSSLALGFLSKYLYIIKLIFIAYIN